MFNNYHLIKELELHALDLEDARRPAGLEVDPEAELAESETIKDQIMHMFKTNRMAAVSAGIILIFILVAVFAPLVAPYDPNAQTLADRLQGPSAKYWLGTDEFGRDVLSRMIYGSRISLLVGLIPTTISMTIGTLLGLIAGYRGGKIDYFIMRLADVLLAFPSLLLAMLIAYTIGKGLLTIFIALSFVSWAGTARVVRSLTLSLREKEYIEAAVSVGVNKRKIILRHLLPNCIPTLIILFTMNVPGNILSESSLSFLGVGAQPPSTSWGLMVFRSKKYLSKTPVATLAPGVAILILVMAFNFLGDALRDAIDPYMKE